MSTEPDAIPRETVVKIAKTYRELELLRANEKRTMAKMIRACLRGLHSKNNNKRHEAKVALTDLARMLEQQAGPEEKVDE